jgi:signal peptidase II
MPVSDRKPEADSNKATADENVPMAGRCRAAIVRFAVIVIVLLTADLVVKSVTFARVAGEPIDVAAQEGPIPIHDPVVLVPNVLALKLTLNEGAAFGLGQGGRWLFLVIGAVALVIIVGVFRATPAKAWGTHMALAMLMAGAIGNIYDRLVYARVRDMFWLFPDVSLPFGLHWPGGSDQVYPWIWNIADAAMCVGLVIMLIALWRKK